MVRSDIHGKRPIMVYGHICSEAKRITSRYGDRLSSCPSLAADIASQVITREVGHWRIIVGVWSNVGIDWIQSSSMGELLEDI